MMRKSRKLYLWLSLVILTVDSLFIIIYFQTSSRALQESLEAQGERKKSAYDLTFQATLDNMLQMVTLNSLDRHLQQLFMAGKAAVEAEGGGAGGLRAAAIRQKLFEEVGPGWKMMTEKYNVRQLHFHIGPGSLSFLRVHKPDKFGDRMDKLRHTIVDSYAQASSLSGFETGRIYSGLRGVVPMYASDPETGRRVHVGTLEAGTSFENTFNLLDRNMNSGVAALLSTEHVSSTMWEESIDSVFGSKTSNCNCVVEAASRDVAKVLRALLDQHGIPIDSTGTLTRRVLVDGQNISVTSFPLFDYLALRNKTNRPVGTILIWSNVDQAVAAFKRDLSVAVGYAILGYLLIEILLYFGIKFSTRHLERKISVSTMELRELNTNLQEEIQRHNETQIQLADTECFWSSVADNIKSPLMVISSDYHLQLANKAARALTSDPNPGNLTCYQLSHHSDTVCSGDDHPCPLNMVMETGKPLVVTHQHSSAQGEIRLVDIHAWPLRDSKGNITGIVELEEDVTERMENREALRKSETMLRKTQAIVQTGSWSLDSSSDQLFWSDEMYNLFETMPDHPLTREEIIQRMHPDDREMMRDAWQKARQGSPLDICYRVQLGGKEKWLHEQAEIDLNPDGKLHSALGSVQDVTRQKHEESELFKSRLAAEKAAKIKSDFLANMSHEIRTPLNSVLGMAGIGLRDSHEEKLTQCFQYILDSGQHLLGIINDILDLSKLDAGKLVIESHLFQLSSVVDEALDLVITQAREKGLTLSIQRSPDLPAWVVGDALRLRQIILNLLSNAIKFTEQGEVNFSVSQENGEMIFTVMDSGIGMSAEQLSQLFTPFHQLDDSTTRRYGGTGLGLVISQNFARLMHGDITVESVLGEGSTFSLRLPLAEATTDIGDKVSHPESRDSHLTGMRILAVEDVEMNRVILEDLLEYEGAHVIFAEDGQQAIDRLEEHGVTSFDLVLMDIQMPVMDGYEATRRILEMAPGLPVIGVSAHALTDDRAKCLAAGMVEHVTKPIDPDTLIAAIQYHADIAGRQR